MLNERSSGIPWGVQLGWGKRITALVHFVPSRRSHCMQTYSFGLSPLMLRGDVSTCIITMECRQ